jgi:two-component system response regulator VanR
LEICHELHKEFNIPVILLGNDPSPDIWKKALVSAEADFYVRKPFDMDELVARIKAILRRYKKNETEKQTILAKEMGISVSQVYRVKQGKRRINEKFITGTVKAFPEYKLDELFHVAPKDR